MISRCIALALSLLVACPWCCCLGELLGGTEVGVAEPVHTCCSSRAQSPAPGGSQPAPAGSPCDCEIPGEILAPAPGWEAFSASSGLPRFLPLQNVAEAVPRPAPYLVAVSDAVFLARSGAPPGRLALIWFQRLLV